MQNDAPMQKSEPLVTKSSLGWAGAAAFLACAACCALPMLALASGGVLASISAFLSPGAELVAALVAGGATVAFFAVRSAVRSRCETTCSADASCCAPESRRS
jgi:hypothetical protein